MPGGSPCWGCLCQSPRPWVPELPRRCWKPEKPPPGSAASPGRCSGEDLSPPGPGPALGTCCSPQSPPWLGRTGLWPLRPFRTLPARFGTAVGAHGAAAAPGAIAAGGALGQGLPSLVCPQAPSWGSSTVPPQPRARCATPRPPRLGTVGKKHHEGQTQSLASVTTFISRPAAGHPHLTSALRAPTGR